MSGSVCVINTKGGCGKTTVSTHIAAALSLSGLDTALADFDRQRNSLLWLRLRGDRKPRIRAIEWRKDFGNTPKKVRRLVIDCPASLRVKHARDVIRESDVIVVPVMPSVFDEATSRKFLKSLEELKPIRKGRKPILLVANRYRANSIAAKRLEEFVTANNYALMARIPDRSLYPAVAEKGETVFDSNSVAMRQQQNNWLPLIAAIEDCLKDDAPLPVNLK